MTRPLVPSALDANTQSFPVLSDDQIQRIRPLAQVRSVPAGEVLFQPRDAAPPFFVLLTGAMEIVQPSLNGERAIASHGPGEFTGEMTMISGQACLVLGRVTEPGEFLELDSAALHLLVARDAELSEILMRAFILRRLALVSKGYGNAVLLGSRHSAQTLALREFFSRNGHPYTYVDLDEDRTSQELLDRFNVRPSEIPVVISEGGIVLRNPSTRQVAQSLGLNSGVDRAQVRDLIIIGAGPAGLGAAVYAASEGLDVLIIETHAPGGQAGSSSKIENYLGFPTGVSGHELAARATTQAQKFGAELLIARSVVRIHCSGQPNEVLFDNGETARARSLVIATGAHYNKPNLKNLERFEGRGVYYWATFIEAQVCGEGEVAVVGGGNSAGQAAAFLSQTACKVHLVVRAPELRSSMSRYLIQRLTENARIELHYSTEIVELEGDQALERVRWVNKTTGEESTAPISHLFIMTGASPRTEWLRGCLALSDKGFILTGRDVEGGAASDDHPAWPLSRPPQMLETSLPGVFAVGDVRSGNVKRVASAVGEGSIAVHMVHTALAAL